MKPLIVERMQTMQTKRGYSIRRGCTSRGVRTRLNQSERGYSVRHASTIPSAAIAYVTGCTYTVRPIRARLWRTSQGVRTLFDQSECGYGVRHGVYIRFSTNQSTAIAYGEAECIDYF